MAKCTASADVQGATYRLWSEVAPLLASLKDPLVRI